MFCNLMILGFALSGTITLNRPVEEEGEEEEEEEEEEG